MQFYFYDEQTYWNLQKNKEWCRKQNLIKILKLNSRRISSVAAFFVLLWPAEVYVSHEKVELWSSFLGIREYARAPNLSSLTNIPFFFRTVLMTLNGHCRCIGLPTSPCIIEVVSFIILTRCVEPRCTQALNKEKFYWTTNELEKKHK